MFFYDDGFGYWLLGYMCEVLYDLLMVVLLDFLYNLLFCLLDVDCLDVCCDEFVLWKLWCCDSCFYCLFGSLGFSC